MSQRPAEIRILLSRGREILILRQRGDEPQPWTLLATTRNPREPIDAAAGRCGRETAGLLLIVRATLPPIPLSHGGRAGDCHLVVARLVEEQGVFPDACETRWILQPHWVEYDFEPVSRLLLTHYQSSADQA